LRLEELLGVGQMAVRGNGVQEWVVEKYYCAGFAIFTLVTATRSFESWERKDL